MFSCPDKRDRGLSRGYGRKSTPSLPMPIQFSHNNRPHINRILKRLGLRTGGLPNQGIQDENHLVWFDRFIYRLHLSKEGGLLFVPTRSIHNNDLKLVLLKPADTVPSYHCRILDFRTAVVRDV